MTGFSTNLRRRPPPEHGEGRGDAAALGSPLLAALSRVGCGGMILTDAGEIHAINAEARTILADELGLGRKAAAGLPEAGREAIKALLARGSKRFRLGSDSWLSIPREGRRPLVLQALPMPGGPDARVNTALILIDLDVVPPPSGTALEQIFGLTPTEARLTVLLTGGASPAEAAQAQGVSLATVRKHLASIFGKTRTRGQVELVVLAARLAGLP